MKKLFVFLLILLCTSIVFAYEGDSLGNHKARKDLNMDAKKIDDAMEVQVGTITARAGEPQINVSSPIVTRCLFTIEGSSLVIRSADGTISGWLYSDGTDIIFESNNGDLVLNAFGNVVSDTNVFVREGMNFVAYNVNNTSSVLVYFYGAWGYFDTTDGGIIMQPANGIFAIRESGINEELQIWSSDGVNYLRISSNSIWSSTDRINLLSKTSFYGSSWWNGHDAKGLDNVEANSFTVANEYTLPTADGNADDIIETNGAGVLSWVAPSAGAGNKNDEENLEAEQFSTAGASNASIYLHQDEIPYDGVTSTGSMHTVKLPDSARPNFAFGSMNWSRQWDDSTVNIFVTFVTSSTSEGNANLRVGIGTCTFVGGEFEIYDSTTAVGSGWCDQRTATMTITSTDILFDGKHIIVHIGRGNEDTSVQTVYVLNVKFAFAKD